MRKNFAKKISLLSLVLIAASAVTTAAFPEKSNGKKANNGTLRLFSCTLAGVGQDAAAAVASCCGISGAVSCTASATNTTTDFFAYESRWLIGELYYQTVGNTSQTNPNDGVDQNSVLQQII